MFAAVLCVATGCTSARRREEPQRTAVALPARVTGANLRAVGDRRRGYGTKKARETMERLRAMGVNTISILMEGRMRDLGDTEVRLPDADELDDLQAALRDANEMGFATVLIPHIYLDDGEWRGRIAFGAGDVARRDAWWGSYGAFISAAADLAADCGATVLSIGVELKGLSGEADTRERMRSLRDAVRGGGYRGLTTYSANWDEAEGVAFWDLVDVAGVNGYYPLVPEPVRGAEAIARRLASLRQTSGKDVLVLEVGYRAGPLSHVRPWEWPEEVGNPEVDETAQALAWAAVLGHWLDAPGVRGLLLWVIPTDPDDPASEPQHGFNPLNRPAEEIIRKAFTGATRGAT